MVRIIKSKQFVPITIVIETEDELKFFCDIANLSTNDIKKITEYCKNVEDIQTDLYRELQEFKTW